MTVLYYQILEVLLKLSIYTVRFDVLMAEVRTPLCRVIVQAVVVRNYYT
jgi:hypothetical protein